MMDPDHYDIKTILVGIDGSQESRMATQFAAALAFQLGADVVAAHAVGLLDVWAEHESTAADDHPHALVSALMEGDWTKPLRERGVEARVILRDGPPSIVLPALADEVDADLIVVGSRGAGQADLYALGTTSAILTQRSTRPVVVVPCPRPGWNG